MTMGVARDMNNKLDVGDELEAKTDIFGPAAEDGQPVLLHKAGKCYKVVLSGPTAVVTIAETGLKSQIDRESPFLLNFRWHPMAVCQAGVKIDGAAEN